MTLRRTRHGPLLEHHFNDFAPKYGTNAVEEAFSLATTTHIRNDNSVSVILGSFFEDELDSTKFKAYARQIKTPNLDILTITSKGEFSYFGTGLIPAKKNALSGCFMKNGSAFNSEYVDRQIRLLPFMPNLDNPARNYITLANNKFAPS